VLKGSVAVCFGLLAFCVGCAPTNDASERVESRPPAELVESLIAGSKEFNFLLSEDAGTDSYHACVGDIKGLVDSLSESLAGSGVDQAEAEKLAKGVEQVKVAYESFASAVKANGSGAQMAKANAAFNKKLKTVAKLFN